MTDYSPHQKKIIERYYDRRDQIMVARLQEIVTDLFLAESDRKTDQLWLKADKAMAALKVPEAMRAQIMSKRDPENLARHVRRWLDAAARCKPRG